LCIKTLVSAAIKEHFLLGGHFNFIFSSLELSWPFLKVKVSESFDFSLENGLIGNLELWDEAKNPW